MGRQVRNTELPRRFMCCAALYPEVPTGNEKDGQLLYDARAPSGNGNFFLPHLQGLVDLASVLESGAGSHQHQTCDITLIRPTHFGDANPLTVIRRETKKVLEAQHPVAQGVSRSCSRGLVGCRTVCRTSRRHICFANPGITTCTKTHAERHPSRETGTHHPQGPPASGLDMHLYGTSHAVPIFLD
jgi:hypothetical protein